MTTYNTQTYAVVSGTVVGIAAFNTAMQTQVDAGYTPVGSPWVDGTNIYQTVVKQANSAFTATWYITVAPTVGVAGAGAFTLVGDVTTQFPIGFRFTVVGSTGNDGVYAVRVTPTFGAGNTVIAVEEAVLDATADGQIIQFAAI